MNNHVYRFAVLVALIAMVNLSVLSQDSLSRGGNARLKPHSFELTESITRMHAAMASVELSGESDVDFMRLMLPHHQAALEMAQAELIHGKDPQVRRLAQEIITDQQSEIELMQLWLKQHGPNLHKDNHRSATNAEKER